MAKPLHPPEFPGYLDTCFQCHNEWGACKCKQHDPDVGFDFNEFWITDPLVSVCGRFFVDPYVYYGVAYTDFLARARE